MDIQTKNKSSQKWRKMKERVVSSVITAITCAIAAIVVWALHSAYGLDAKIEHEVNKLRNEMIDGQNESVHRDADLQSQIEALKKNTEAPPLPPFLPPDVTPANPIPLAPGNSAPPLNPAQNTLNYLQQNSKRYTK